MADAEGFVHSVRLLRKWVIGVAWLISSCPWHLGPIAYYYGIVSNPLCGTQPVLLGEDKEQMVQKNSNPLTIELTENAPHPYIHSHKGRLFRSFPEIGAIASTDF